jgi:hypothetical protein
MYSPPAPQVVAYLQVKVFLHGLQLSDHAAVRYYLQHQLSKGWILGRPVDLSDAQWRGFRDSLPLLAAAMASFVVLSRAVRQGLGSPGADEAGMAFDMTDLDSFAPSLKARALQWTPPSRTAEPQSEHQKSGIRSMFYVAFSLVFLCELHSCP